MKKLILASSLVFLLAVVYAVESAVVPGAVLILDAANNPADPDAWTNLGTAGGELSGEGNPPKLDDGTIEIPALGIKAPNSKFYTHKEAGQCFGGPGDALELFLEDWTIEFLLRSNGGQFAEGVQAAGMHQLAGVTTPPEAEHQQGIRIVFWGASSQLGIWPYGPGWPNAPLKVILEEGQWNWVALSAKNNDKILVYQNGKQVSEQPGMDFHKDIPLDVIIIGATAPDNKDRSFNGSIAFVRLYDKALTEEQVNQNIRAFAAVDPASKLTTTWGIAKTRH